MAKLYLAIGVNFETAWLERIAATNPKMRVVHTDHGIEKIPMMLHDHENKDHTENGKHRDEKNPLAAKEIRGQVAIVDPLAEEWPTNLRDVAHKFKAALR